MVNQPTYEAHLDRANRAGLILGAAIEVLTVGGLAIYAAYHDYWQLVVVTLTYVVYAVFKLRYDRRKARSGPLMDSDDEADQSGNADSPTSSRGESKWIKSTPSQRRWAVVLALIYCALMGLAFYLESIKIEDRWPTWLLWAGGVIGFATLLVLPIAVVMVFFGLDASAFGIRRRFTLRGMLRAMFWASLFFWYCTQMYWVIERQQWRIANGATTQSTEGRAPPVLRLLNEHGESRIEIRNATKEQLAEAKRLFPEATVVAKGKLQE